MEREELEKKKKELELMQKRVDLQKSMYENKLKQQRNPLLFNTMNRQQIQPQQFAAAFPQDDIGQLIANQRAQNA